MDFALVIDTATLMEDVSLELTAQVTDVDLFINQAKNVHPNSADGITLAGVYRYDL